MAAFERALQDGADGIELDVRMTTDGELFVTHDDIIETSAGPKALGRLSASQVDQLETISGHSIPRLREVLEFQARTGAYVNIELKGDVRAPLWVARRAADLITAHGGSGLLISSFHVLQLREAIVRLPQVPCALLYDDSTLSWAQNRTSLASTLRSWLTRASTPLALAVVRDA